MPLRSSRLRWLAALSTVLSLGTCYGTLVVIALMGMLGTAIDLNQTVWAAAIVSFALIAIAGLGLGFTRHRLPWPILVGGFGAAAISYAMYVHYERLTEVAGFVLLSVAAIWDWRIGRLPARQNQTPE